MKLYPVEMCIQKQNHKGVKDWKRTEQEGREGHRELVNGIQEL